MELEVDDRYANEIADIVNKDDSNNSVEKCIEQSSDAGVITTISDDVPADELHEQEDHVSESACNEELRHFDVLDDLEHNTNQDDSDSEGCSNDSVESDDIPDDEIEAMLEEGLPDKFKKKRKKNDLLYEEKEKLVLDEIGHNHFDVLPEGWVQVILNHQEYQ